VAAFLFDEQIGTRVGLSQPWPVVNTGLGNGLLPGVSGVMGLGNLDVGTRLPLKQKLMKAVATAALAGTLGLGLFMSTVSTAVSSGETRTISMVNQHTRENITVTYMQNGRYVPSAMKKINYFLRDWRRNEVITIDPKTIDLVWELHADLGSKKPIHIVCGYRSAKTNSFLKRIGRNVAKKSQHTRGKAIDFFFPDVNTQKIRNSALARRVGGVGYYRSAGGPTGFLHADSGNVRHWGPSISRSQLASIISEGRKTIGRRAGKRGVFADAPETAVAEANDKKSGSIWGLITGKKRGAEPAPETVVAAIEPEPAPALEAAYEADEDELANLSADAAAASNIEAKAKAKKLIAAPVAEEPAFVEDQQVAEEVLPAKSRGALAALAGTAAVEEQAERRPTPVAASMASFVPRPKLKPKQVLTLALAKNLTSDDVVIQPVSAEPDQGWSKKSNKPSKVADPIGTVENADSLMEPDEGLQVTADGKSNLATDLRNINAEELVVIEPVMASQTEPGWLTSLYASAEASLRRDGVSPAPAAATSLPVAAVLGPDGSGEIEIAPPVAAEGKGDSLLVNREGKTGLPPLKLRLSSRLNTAEE
jgi:uncharacterized protein YcbK (DUF882 family)